MCILVDTRCRVYFRFFIRLYRNIRVIRFSNNCATVRRSKPCCFKLIFRTPSSWKPCGKSIWITDRRPPRPRAADLLLTASDLFCYRATNRRRAIILSAVPLVRPIAVGTFRRRIPTPATCLQAPVHFR